MGDGVVREALHRVVVAVLEDTLQLARPDDDALVRTTAREPFSILCVVYAVHGILDSIKYIYIEGHHCHNSFYGNTTFVPWGSVLDYYLVFLEWLYRTTTLCTLNGCILYRTTT